MRAMGSMGRMGMMGAVLVTMVAVAAVPPVPKIANRRSQISKRTALAATQGAGAMALISKPMAPPTLEVTGWRTNTLTWLYPKTINASNYWWNLETSTDFKTWTVVCSNATGIYTWTNDKTDRVRVFRLKGRSTP
jgi:hypothetical protein